MPRSSRRHKGASRTRRRGSAVAATNAISGDGNLFVPQTPIPVLLAEDGVRLDPNEAQPSAAVHQPPEVWVKHGEKKVPVPPPAYGRWRGSVRADPELLHWHAIPAPIDENEPNIPSPTYEVSPTSGAGSPPSYKTKGTSPRSQKIAQPSVEPEMVEGRGIGV